MKLKEDGSTQLQQNHFASDQIQKMLGQLDEVWLHLNDTWEDRKQLLTQCYDLQVFLSSYSTYDTIYVRLYVSFVCINKVIANTGTKIFNTVSIFCISEIHKHYHRSVKT